jgi:hypothetical protein
VSDLTLEQLDEAASWFASAWKAPSRSTGVAIWADTYGERLLAAARAGIGAQAVMAEHDRWRNAIEYALSRAGLVWCDVCSDIGTRSASDPLICAACVSELASVASAPSDAEAGR